MSEVKGKKSQEANINFKINQVIKSGVYKIGKYTAAVTSLI